MPEVAAPSSTYYSLVLYHGTKIWIKPLLALDSVALLARCAITCISLSFATSLDARRLLRLRSMLPP